MNLNYSDSLEKRIPIIEAVYADRSQPPNDPLAETYRQILADYRTTCESLRDSTHEKTRVLFFSHLPLTNNEAECALRHWVILRGICLGARLFAILIRMIKNCRARQPSP